VGNKVNPIGFRVGVSRGWDSCWFARGSYGETVQEDLTIRDYIRKKLAHAEVGKVEIERAGDNVRVIIHSARPGVVIGKKGQEIENIRTDLAKQLKKRNIDVSVKELQSPETNARVIAQSIADQIERRANYKKVIKKAVATAERAGVSIKVRVAGRLGGSEIARIEWMHVGSIPLHTLRSEIDYATAQAHTQYGVIGVKVWIGKGEYQTNRMA